MGFDGDFKHFKHPNILVLRNPNQRKKGNYLSFETRSSSKKNGRLGMGDLFWDAPKLGHQSQD